MNEVLKSLPHPGTWAQIVVLFAVIGLLLMGCSGDPEPGTQNFVTNQSTNQNQTDPDAGTNANSSDDRDTDHNEHNAVTDPDAGDVGSGEDAGDVGEDPDTGPDEIHGPCGPVVDLGTLTPGETTITVDFADFDNRESTGCSNALDSEEIILAFQLPANGGLDVEASQPLAMELRFNDCQQTGGVICQEGGLSIQSINRGPTFYLFLERLPQTASDSVDVSISFDSVTTCLDQWNQSECVDGETVRVCRTSTSSPDIPQWEEAPCPDACENGRCVGDSCANPLVVTGGELVVGVMGEVLFDEHNSETEMTCSVDGAGPGLYTPGRDLIVALPNLNPQKTVTISVNGHPAEEDLVLMIKTQCGDGPSCVAVWEGETEVTFQPSSGGTYYLVVDMLADQMSYFGLTVVID